jgi:hypothetical protein
MQSGKKPIFAPPAPTSPEHKGKLIKRSEAARMLGVSVSTLRRREGNLVNPIIGPDGIRLFDEAEVRSVSITVRQQQSISAIGPRGGDVAAEVFTLLDDGVHGVEIVKRLRLPPDVVVALQAQWAGMRGGFVVTQEEADELAVHTRARRATSARVAVAQVESRVAALLRLRGGGRCKFCGDSSACACESCVIQARGPLWTVEVKLERRNDGAGEEELRVVAEVCWDQSLSDGGGRGVAVRSDWFPRALGARSPISDFIDALEPSAKTDGITSS